MRVKLVLPALAMVMLASAPATAASAHDRSGDDDRHVVAHTEFTTEKQWEMTSATCSNLPAGAHLVGTGRQTDVVTVTEEDGVFKLVWTGRSSGTAIDQDGNHYRWRYANTDRQRTARGGSPTAFSGQIVDSFRLSGDGPIKLRAGFVADVTSTVVGLEETITSWTFRSLSGDAVDAVTIANRCDPL